MIVPNHDRPISMIYNTQNLRDKLRLDLQAH